MMGAAASAPSASSSIATDTRVHRSSHRVSGNTATGDKRQHRHEIETPEKSVRKSSSPSRSARASEITALPQSALKNNSVVSLPNFIATDAVVILPNRLVWAIVPPDFPGLWSAEHSATSRLHFFNTDHTFLYENYFSDFGPLHIGHTYRFCQMLCEKMAPDEVCQLFSRFRLIPFRDATYGICTYAMTLADCVYGMNRALKLGWFDYHTFDIDTYEYYERTENGDLHELVPGKFFALSGPEEKELRGVEICQMLLEPQDYIEIFKRFNINLVIRLNKKQYDARVYTACGIEHVDLYMTDGSVPTPGIISKFIEICEKASGAIAVHCKAGLGRTGTLVGCYAIKHYGFTGREWIAWNRLCRPGSVLGPQQQFLSIIEKDVLLKPPRLAQGEIAVALNELSQEDRQTAQYGDRGQGNRLVGSRRLQQQLQQDAHSQNRPQAEAAGKDFSNKSLQNSEASPTTVTVGGGKGSVILQDHIYSQMKSENSFPDVSPLSPNSRLKMHDGFAPAIYNGSVKYATETTPMSPPRTPAHTGLTLVEYTPPVNSVRKASQEATCDSNNPHAIFPKSIAANGGKLQDHTAFKKTTESASLRPSKIVPI